MLPNITMVVHYDEIIHSPQKTCDRVFDFCGLSDHKLHKNKLNGDIGCSDPYKVFMQELIDQLVFIELYEKFVSENASLWAMLIGFYLLNLSFHQLFNDCACGNA